MPDFGRFWFTGGVEADVITTNTGSPGELLRLLRDGRPRTRAELVVETGLARSTVRARLDSLLDAGLITDGGNGASTGGRPASRLVFNARAKIALAAEVGATHATIAAADLTGALLATDKLDLDIAEGPESVLPLLITAWRELLRASGLDQLPLAGVGIGLPGPVEHSTGKPNNPPIMPGWDGYDVPARVAADLGVPVLVDNEVNLMALGEHATCFPHAQDMIVVKVATGIGSGFISNGALHRGAVGAAGDLGHILAPNGGDAHCRCGNTGCLEAVASGPAIAAKLHASGLDAQTSADVVALVRAGNLEAGQAVRQAGRDIGDVLAACVSMFNPSLIVVGGSVALAGEMLLAGVREAIYRRSLPLATENLAIVPSQAGIDAGVLGAATMVVQHALSPAVIDHQLTG
ncbi:Sugar kinase of the NBD/HSP70 family, may contain an N-terminal HTH domain [Actinokineospora alba]|uniref:Sugar kinase of the NBD/HSP70 family, may contain an N-terminal HTH domain n=1 Tax=Actinokineospora alba TaxID=504798 RepID=A0A1H0NMH2_9PSEU|nr:putative NBD/HSP70 family sugar kinase [Actinokineospora alba]SDH86447.1 Sugar kinase of the NBD/HSP70 family, may contain an N-terminal HTH domain [Actinokineospora alba]SDO93957.1 Sugar kinase of the NBD/HSP70 family, may contain an N-terminal HTH domain [Actinokineospora alba]